MTFGGKDGLGEVLVYKCAGEAWVCCKIGFVYGLIPCVDGSRIVYGADKVG